MKKCPVLKSNCTDTDILTVISVDQFVNLLFVANNLSDQVFWV